MVVRHECYVVVTLKIHLIHLKIFQGLQTHMAWMIVQNYQDSAWGFVCIEVIQPCQEEIFIYVPWLAHCHYRAWRQAVLKFWVFPNTFKNDYWRDESTGCVTTCNDGYIFLSFCVGNSNNFSFPLLIYYLRRPVIKWKTTLIHKGHIIRLVTQFKLVRNFFQVAEKMRNWLPI